MAAPRPMNIVEKIIAHHALGLTRCVTAAKPSGLPLARDFCAHLLTPISPPPSPSFIVRRPWVAPGEAVCVRVDWTMANELTLVGINDMYTKIGRPGVANKERVWLAVDHTVDPRNYSEPKPSALIKLADDFAEETGITDYWRPNTTIMVRGGGF